MTDIISVEKVNKFFHVGNQDIHILKDIDMAVRQGEFLIIFGPSGCGKSTLLHTILGLEPPTSGRVTFIGSDMYNHSTEDDLAELRKKHVGMIYQQANWIKALTVLENIAFPLLLLGNDQETSNAKAMEKLTTVGMEAWANYIPTELSSGQQQRISLARALVTHPEVIIADEPTGNLDFNSGQDLMNLFTQLNSQGITIIMVTHDLEYLKYSQRAVQMLDGKIVNTFDQKDHKRLSASLHYKRGQN